MHSGSTDVSSDSIDIEEISSDSDSTSTDSDEEEEAPANQFSSSAHAERMSRMYKGVDIIHKSASANVIHGSSPKRQRRPRDRRSSESNTKIKEEPTSSKLGSPKKAQKGQVNVPGFELGYKSIHEPLVDGLFTGAGRDVLEYDNGDRAYSSSDSSDSEESDGDNEEHTTSEMTRLLSLNDQDMYESGEEGEEREMAEYEGQAAGWGGGVSGESGKEVGQAGANDKGTTDCNVS